ncbi:MAG TPA: hypothetical protein VKQ72_22615 [Aggregatilineales bacterium]|nr:hypothetical protein [Aggregatilineales bacterium]
MTEAADWVASRIIERYGRPGRVAYMVMFRLQNSADFSHIVPPRESIVAAWIDAGSGLLPATAESALERCKILQAVHTLARAPHQMTADERRQMMARSVLFSVQQTATDLVEVRLISRSLTFSPKGDREANEQWKPGSEGWYSAYRPRDEDDE